MTKYTYTALLRDKKISATQQQLKKFSELYISDAELIGRFSELFWFDLYVLNMEFGIGPPEILESVKSLEGGEQSQRGVKPATPFKKAPLKGLWHKHYFSAHFLVHNMLNGLGKNGLSKIVEEVMDPSKSTVVTEEMIEELAHRVTHEPLESRDSNGKLTGEWIVFLKRNSKNYYLCTNTHSAGDQFIYDRIIDNCHRTFTYIKEWIAEEAAKLA